MKIAMGCDSAGISLKETLKAFIESKGIEVVDFGIGEGEDTHYPIIAQKVAETVSRGDFERAVLICGTGIGMAIVANKVPGIRAAVCHDSYSAERARKSNNAQIIAMGARVIGTELAKSLLEVWLKSEFEGGNSTPKVKLIASIDSSYRNCCK